MPRVPETFAPGVAQSAVPMTPATGPWVSPMRNRAPQQLERTGQTLEQAGSLETHLGNTIGDAVEQTINDAKSRAAETQFLAQTQDILSNPETGYLYTKGLAARSQWQSTAEALSKARQTARATLTNPVQQRAFDAASTPHLLSIGRQMNLHQHQQVTQYGIEQGQAHADSLSGLARDAYLSGRLTDYQTYSGQARNAVLKVAELTSGAPPTSDVAQAMVKAKATDLAKSIVVGLLDKNQYAEAGEYLAAQKDAIDPDTEEMLDRAVKAESSRALVLTKKGDFEAAAANGGKTPYTYGPLAAGSTINPMRITDRPGSPRPGGRVHDGYDIAMAAGTAVTAPLSGTVEKVWDDTKFGGGLSMEVKLADGNTLGIAHLSHVNLKPGEKVDRGQVLALSGKTGNATGPCLHVALKDPDGKFVDYFAAGQAQPDAGGIADPDVLARAIALAKKDTSLTPAQQQQVIRGMEADHAQARSLEDQQYAKVKQNAIDYWYAHGHSLDGYPASERMKLKPQDLDALTQPPPKEDDLAKVFAFESASPQDRTMKNLNAIAGSLTPRTYMRLAKGVLATENATEDLPAATVPHDLFQGALLADGFSNLLNPKSGTDDQATFIRLKANIEEVGRDEEQVLRRKLRPDEWKKIINDHLTQQVFVEHAHLLPGIGISTIPSMLGMNLPRLYTRDYGVATKLGAVTPEELPRTYVMATGGVKVYTADIPPGLRARYEAQLLLANTRLAEAGKPQVPITEQSIANAWVAAGRPKAATKR